MKGSASTLTQRNRKELTSFRKHIINFCLTSLHPPKYFAKKPFPRHLSSSSAMSLHASEVYYWNEHCACEKNRGCSHLVGFEDSRGAGAFSHDLAVTVTLDTTVTDGRHVARKFLLMF